VKQNLALCSHHALENRDPPLSICDRLGHASQTRTQRAISPQGRRQGDAGYNA